MLLSLFAFSSVRCNIYMFLNHSTQTWLSVYRPFSLSAEVNMACHTSIMRYSQNRPKKNLDRKIQPDALHLNSEANSYQEQNICILNSDMRTGFHSAASLARYTTPHHSLLFSFLSAKERKKKKKRKPRGPIWSCDSLSTTAYFSIQSLFIS